MGIDRKGPVRELPCLARELSFDASFSSLLVSKIEAHRFLLCSLVLEELDAHYEPTAHNAKGRMEQVELKVRAISLCSR